MDYTIILLVITILLILQSLYKDRIYQKSFKEFNEERKDLLNRIMAKNLDEYKNINDNTLPKGNNHLKKMMKEKDFEDLYR